MPSLSDIRVLVVDDNEQMRVLLRCLLRAGGIQHMIEASGADAGYAQLRARPIDLVIVDWRMSPADGIDFTRMVRLGEESPNPYVPILMLTAHTEASRVAAARDAGVSGFVKKPISARLLYERISNALTDARMFVRSADFFGPDRRREQASGYAGPFRRASDAPETLLIDDARCA